MLERVRQATAQCQATAMATTARSVRLPAHQRRTYGKARRNSRWPGMCPLRHSDQSGALDPALLLQPVPDKGVSGIARSSVSAMIDRLTLTRAFEGAGIQKGDP